MKNTSMYAAFGVLGALAAGGLSAYDKEIRIDSRPGLLWSDAELWGGSLPTAEQSALIDMYDSVNPFVVDTDVGVKSLDLGKYAVLEIDGALGGALRLNGGDLSLWEDTSVSLKNGAELSTGPGKSLWMRTAGANGALRSDASTFSGKFYNAARAEFSNNSLHLALDSGNMYNTSNAGYAVYNASVLDGKFAASAANDSFARVDAANGLKVTFTNGSTVKMGLSDSGEFDFASDLYTTGGGTVSVALGSSIVLEDGSKFSARYLDVGSSRELGSSGSAVFTLGGQGREAFLSVFGFNVNASGALASESVSKMVFAGNSKSYVNGQFYMAGLHNYSVSGSAEMVFENSGNSVFSRANLEMGHSRTDGSAGIDIHTKISTAEGASGNVLDFQSEGRSIRMMASAGEGNTSSNSIDFSGAGNVVRVGDLTLENSVAQNSSFANSVKISKGAELDVSGTLNVGSYSAKSGSSTVEISDGGNLAVKNIRMRMSQEEGSSASSKFVVRSSSVTVGGELYFGNGASDYSVSGSAAVEITGKGSELYCSANGIYPGWNSNVSGGDKYFIINGTDNRAVFENREFNLHGNMNGAVQSGGSFSLSISGEGNSLTASNMNIGAAASYGGRNSASIAGASQSASGALYLSGGNLSVNLSNADAAIGIENSFGLAGNAVLAKNAAFDGVNVNVGASSSKGGLARFSVLGAGNRLAGADAAVGNADSSGGLAVFEVGGSGSDISFRNFAVRGAAGASVSAVYGGKLLLRPDDGGISRISLSGSDFSFTGLLEIDLRGITADFGGVEQAFTLMSSLNCDFTDALSGWFDFEKSVENREKVNVIARGDGDSWAFRVDGGPQGGYSLVMLYTSTVPEPAFCAALFGAAAALFVARRRRGGGAA